MWKLCRKLRNAKIYPLEVRILQKKFDVISWTIKSIIPHIWAYIIKTGFSKLEFLFSVLGSTVSKNICKLCHKFKKMPKIYPNSLGHDKINLDLLLTYNHSIQPLVREC